MVLTSPHAPREKPSSHQVTTSRSSSRSSQSSVGRSSANQDKKRLASPQPHTSRDYRNDSFRGKEYSSRYRRSNSTSRKAVYKTSSLTPARSKHTTRKSRSPYQSPERSRRERTSPGTSGRDRSPSRYYIKQKRSRSPSGYKASHSDRRSRSSSKFVEQRRSPYKHRRHTERKMSRSPHRSSRGRSRSYSPHHRRSRYSRSPHRHSDYRGYERTKRSRSRSPRRRRYTPERNSRRSSHDERIYQPPRIPNPYFEGAEFWIPDPMMQPRFIPRQMIPPGAFPYAPFRPPILPPRAPFRPRIVYNRPLRPKVTSTTTVAMIESSPVTTSATEVSKNSEETHQIVEITGSSSNELEHSASNKKSDESLEK